jgi:hypothetical protein
MSQLEKNCWKRYELSNILFNNIKIALLMQKMFLHGEFVNWIALALWGIFWDPVI